MRPTPKDNDDWFDLSESKIRNRVFSLYRLVRMKHTKQEVRGVFDRVKGNANKLGTLRFVSAKNHIFPSLYSVIKRKYHLNVNIVSFSVLIAECIVVLADPYLGRRIRQMCR